MHTLKYGVTKLPLAQVECIRPAAYGEGSERVQSATNRRSHASSAGRSGVSFARISALGRERREWQQPGESVSSLMQEAAARPFDAATVSNPPRC